MSGAGSDGLIDPEAFVCRGWDLDPGAVGAAAAALRAMGTEVGEAMAEMHYRWQGLAGVYEAPEAERVYRLLDGPYASGQELRQNFVRAADAMETLESELGWVKHVLLEFEGRAAAFRARVVGGVERQVKVEDRQTNVTGGTAQSARYETRIVPWYESPQARVENERLLQEYAEILEKIQRAAVACADVLNGLKPVQCALPAAVYDADMIMQSPEMMPWGSAASGAEQGCAGRVGEVVGDGLYGSWEGMLYLLGYDAATFEWSPDALWAEHDWSRTVESLAGMVDVTVATVVAMIPPAVMDHADSRWLTRQYETADQFWGELLGLDLAGFRAAGQDADDAGVLITPYLEDPAGRWTQTSMNFLGLAIGTRGAGLLVQAGRSGHTPDRLTHASYTALAELKRFGTDLTTSFRDNAKELAHDLRQRLNHARDTLTPVVADGPAHTNTHTPSTPASDGTWYTTNHHHHTDGSGDSGQTPPHHAPGTPGVPGTPDRTGVPGTPNSFLYPEGLPPERTPDGPRPHTPGFPVTQYPPEGTTDGGPGSWQHYDRIPGSSDHALNYQQHITGIGTVPGPDGTGRIPEYTHNHIPYDGHLWRTTPNGPQEIFLEAKGNHDHLLQNWATQSGRQKEVLDRMYKQMERQFNALPAGAKLEWHFQGQ